MPDSIDVLICTHNEVEYIGRALDSLERQTVGAKHFRVVVVDNASDDGVARLVNSYIARLDLAYVVEQRLGLNFARNTGYGSSQADYVAHLDADARAHPQWLENILRVLAEVQPDLCGGPYYPYYLDPKPAWFLDRYNMNYAGDRARFLDQNEYLSGTNMIWRRSFVDQLGGFRNEFGLVGRGLARGDETELIQRARAQYNGFRAYYDPDIIVYHLTRPETFSLTYWLRRFFVYGLTQQTASARNKYSPNDGIARLLRQIIRSWAIMTAGLVRGTVLRDKDKYVYFENYLYERMLPEAATFGKAYAWWHGRAK